MFSDATQFISYFNRNNADHINLYYVHIFHKYLLLRGSCDVVVMMLLTGAAPVCECVLWPSVCSVDRL